MNQKEMSLRTLSEVRELGAHFDVDAPRRYATITFGHWTLPKVKEQLRIVWRDDGSFDLAVPGYGGNFQTSYNWVGVIEPESDWLGISRLFAEKPLLRRFRSDKQHASYWASLAVYARRMLRKEARERNW